MSNIIISLLSLLITAVISLIFGLAGHLLNFSFWGCALFAFCVQCIVGWLWNSYMEKNVRLRLLEVEAQSLLLEAVQKITVNCAYCNEPNNIGVLLNKNNDFNCIKCKQKNAVNMTISTIRVTEMVDNQEVLNKLFEEAQSATTEEK